MVLLEWKPELIPLANAQQHVQKLGPTVHIYSDDGNTKDNPLASNLFNTCVVLSVALYSSFLKRQRLWTGFQVFHQRGQMHVACWCKTRLLLYKGSKVHVNDPQASPFMEQLDVRSPHRDTWDVFTEGHKQLGSLVKAGMSHMAPARGLIRSALQQSGPCGCKRASTTSGSTKKLHIATSGSDRLDTPGGGGGVLTGSPVWAFIRAAELGGFPGETLIHSTSSSWSSSSTTSSWSTSTSSSSFSSSYWSSTTSTSSC